MPARAPHLRPRVVPPPQEFTNQALRAECNKKESWQMEVLWTRLVPAGLTG